MEPAAPFISFIRNLGTTCGSLSGHPFATSVGGRGEVFRQTLPVDDQWWKSFGDTTLDSLISIAVDRNYSVLTAIDRMNMAKAGLRMERSGFFPTVGINAGWTRQQTSGNTSELPQSTQHYYDVSANMSWELDIFGSIRQRVKAQKETFAASKEEYTAVMVSLSAQVASSYIQLRELQQEPESSGKKLCLTSGRTQNHRSKVQYRACFQGSTWRRPNRYISVLKHPYHSWNPV